MTIEDKKKRDEVSFKEMFKETYRLLNTAFLPGDELFNIKCKIEKLKADGFSECDIRIIELEVQRSKILEDNKGSEDIPIFVALL